MKKATAIFTLLVMLLFALPVLAAEVQHNSPYVGNKSSMRLHRANCPSVEEMHPYNRVFITSRAEAIAQGFVPCKRCKP